MRAGFGLAAVACLAALATARDARADAQYLTTIGRRKLVRPLYEDLMKTPRGAALACSIYAKARAGYHPITQTSIDAIVRQR